MIVSQITDAIEAYAPLRLQEDYDNAGLLIGNPAMECTGVLLTVDVTPRTVAEAAAAGCNLIVAHHPLIFRGIKRLTGSTSGQKAIIDAIRGGIAVYAAHTNLDNAPAGVSSQMAGMLNLTDVQPLDPLTDRSALNAGCGAVGTITPSVSAKDFIERVKRAFGSPVARCTRFAEQAAVTKAALCGGSGSFLIPRAIEAGAEIFVTSDIKYHDFVDYADRIILVDIGHHESENCSKNIFYHIITENFPNFAVRYSQSDTNPINYL